MSAAIGRVWRWLLPWSNNAVSEKTTTDYVTNERKISGGWGLRRLTSSVWGGRRYQSDLAEEYWEAEEKLQPMDIGDLGAGRQEAKAECVPGWWNKFRPSSFVYWPAKKEASGLRRRRGVGRDQDAGDCEIDGEGSEYGTPPPSPTPPSKFLSPFRLFVHSWTVDILPEHYEICFNFLRHFFDLFVVGFLWAVSPPAKLVLEVLGVQGALRLWLHGMAMFFVSTVGMAGLLWVIQEYLPQFALIYGIVQAVVISVSVRQSVIVGEDEEVKEERDSEVKEEQVKDNVENTEMCVFTKSKMWP